MDRILSWDSLQCTKLDWARRSKSIKLWPLHAPPRHAAHAREAAPVVVTRSFVALFSFGSDASRANHPVEDMVTNPALRQPAAPATAHAALYLKQGDRPWNTAFTSREVQLVGGV